jgi:flagellar hook-associated protein 1 FlgK
MVNYGAKILNTASGALSAHQALISVLSNNIANVNTPGYVRRSISLETRAGSSRESGGFGSGVQVGELQRSVDSYLEKLVREAEADKYSFGTQEELLKRVDGLFDLTGGQATIGGAFTEFFTAISDLRANPSSIELRSGLLNKAEALAASIRDTYGEIASVQDEADSRLTGEVEQINAILDDIARLNGAITQQERGGNTAADFRDQREELLRQLSQKVGVSVVEQSDGSSYITLPGGFPLISNTTVRRLSVTQSPSFAGPAGVPPLLSGRPTSYVVFNYAPQGSTSQDIDLSETIRSVGGALGGLLAVRGLNGGTSTSPFSGDGPLVGLGSRIESIARTLLTSFNAAYRGSDEDPGVSGVQGNALDLDGNTPGVFGFFSLQGTTITDSDGDGVASSTDLTASGVVSFANKISLAVTSPRGIAAARDVDPIPGTLTLASGNADNLVALSSLRTTSFALGTVQSPSQMTFEDGYQEMLTYFGGEVSSAQFASKGAESRFIVAKQRLDQKSGVNLDEEFTQLIKFQQAYQASSRLVKTATEMLDTVIGLL